MIVGAALGVTLGKPAADVAMGAGLGIGRFGLGIVAGCFEASFDVAIVGGVFRNTISFWLEFLAGGNDVHELWGTLGVMALNFRQQS